MAIHTHTHMHTSTHTHTQKKQPENKFWQSCAEALVHCWQEYKTVVTMKNSMVVAQKELKLEFPHALAIVLLNIYLKEQKVEAQIDTCILLL